MSIPERRFIATHERGVSLVELIVTIVVIGVSVAGILFVLNSTLRGSADPLVEKQALAIAEAFLEEVQLMPSTYCDPDDPLAATAVDASGCTGGTGGVYKENIGPETTAGPGSQEKRGSTTFPFDNVNDYSGYDSNSEVPPGVKDITGAALSGLSGYRVQIAVAEQGIPAVGTIPAVPAADSLLITVTVTGPGHTSVSLHGYRTRYAPNALP